MKNVLYIMMTVLLCYSQLAMTMNSDMLLSPIIEEEKGWLCEQLKQQCFSELTPQRIEILIQYFDYATYDFLEDLMTNNKRILRSIFKEEMSIAMDKILNAVKIAHRKGYKQLELSTENEIDPIIHLLSSTYISLYTGSMNKFQNAQ